MAFVDPGLWIETYKRGFGRWRWRLKSANGEIVAQGQGYVSEQALDRGLTSIWGGKVFTLENGRSFVDSLERTIEVRRKNKKDTPE